MTDRPPVTDGLSGASTATVFGQHVFPSVDIALEKVGDVVEALLRARFLGEAFSLTENVDEGSGAVMACLLYTSPSPRDGLLSRMPSSA